MPLYREKIAQELEDKKSDFKSGIGQDVVDEFQEAAAELSDISREEIEKTVLLSGLRKVESGSHLRR